MRNSSLHVCVLLFYHSSDFFPRIKDNFCLIVVGVVLRGNQVLLIQEAKHSCYGKYFLPAGRLEPHETLLDGVKREVLEESGLEFEPKQLVLLESNGSCWFSVTFIGEAVGGQLKTVPDMESLQARWFEVTDVQKAESDWFSLHRIHRPDRPVTMLPTISSSSAFDVRRVGILKMTFVPRLADQLSDQTCTGDGFLLTLRICLIPETNSNLILPQTTDRFEWISIEPSSDALNTWSSELPNWMIQLPVNTDLLPLYRL
ncbi:Nucleoside diphosphate-linked moiety X motif 18 [Fasciola hepatica]|uniref:Nucleoside diphosphate-linked moiety X motif 18 n=1 Tax=Fasciola hepatica TaxID=6192 RepID=A0A4E0RKY1_FASHE|nr:Nucleoside diphosphate-linked moiety X motif 18 [Fasciola hepatica]